MAKTIFEELGGKYERQGDYLIPCLTIPAEEEQAIGIWGQRHLGYLKQYRKVTYTTSMLMYGKEARDRKQEIDRQHHTIPNQRTKDQKTSIVEMCITGYGIMDNSIHSTWKSERAAFPRPANRVTHNSMR